MRSECAAARGLSEIPVGLRSSHRLQFLFWAAVLAKRATSDAVTVMAVWYRAVLGALRVAATSSAGRGPAPFRSPGRIPHANRDGFM
jgi:hypothetical protein